MKLATMRIPSLTDDRAEASMRFLKKSNRLLRKHQWKHEVIGLDVLHRHLEQLLKEINPSKLKLKRNQLPLILRGYVSECNEVYNLFESLKDIERIPQIELDQTTEQMVINRATYVFGEILSDIKRNEEVVSGEYIPAR